jgi:hypothetical protein
MIEDRIDFFCNKGGKNEYIGYRNFLYFAAQSLLFSTDFLYELWLNFKSYKPKNLKKPKELENIKEKQASYLVVSDLILSSLCEPIGVNLFKINDEIRPFLLTKLTETDKKSVAKFIQAYANKNRAKLTDNIYNTYCVSAQAILDFRKLEETIISNLKNNKKSDYEKLHNLSIYFGIPNLNSEQGRKRKITLEYALDKSEGNVIEVNFPLELLERIDGYKKPITLLENRLNI